MEIKLTKLQLQLQLYHNKFSVCWTTNVNTEKTTLVILKRMGDPDPNFHLPVLCIWLHFCIVMDDELHGLTNLEHWLLLYEGLDWKKWSTKKAFSSRKAQIIKNTAVEGTKWNFCSTWSYTRLPSLQWEKIGSSVCDVQQISNISNARCNSTANLALLLSC